MIIVRKLLTEYPLSTAYVILTVTVTLFLLLYPGGIG